MTPAARASRPLRSIVMAACLGALLPASAVAMTVEQAYQEMAHRHAALDLGSAGLGKEEGAYLSKLFELIDLAIVEKVQTWTWFQSEGRKGTSFQSYRDRVDALIAVIDDLPAPERLKSTHRLLVEAIRDQREFFAAWEEAVQVSLQGRNNRGAHHSRMNYLRSSSSKLHQVYDRLLKLFPNAGQQNFDAFYDHLCVLDLL
jgi:hypothetical protein